MLMLWNPLAHRQSLGAQRLALANSPSENRIQLLASGRDFAHSLPIVTKLYGCDETGR